MDFGAVNLSSRRITGESHPHSVTRAATFHGAKYSTENEADAEPRIDRGTQDSFSLQESIFCSECTFSKIDFFGRMGWRSDYTIRDAAISLWQKELVSTAADTSTGAEQFQLRLCDDSFSLTPTEEQLERCIARLRASKDLPVEWRSLAREFMSFRAASHEYLQDSIDYLASRYVSIKDKLLRICPSAELEAEGKKLREICFTEVSEMIVQYTKKLSDNLSLSSSNISDMKASFTASFQSQIQHYERFLPQVYQEIRTDHPEDLWLQNHDGYIAAQLRKAAEGTHPMPDSCYTVWDIGAIGQVARFYQKEIDGAESGNRHEAELALNLAMADMKSEMMIRHGLVTDNMADLLRSIRPQSHSKVLNVADRYLSGTNGKQSASRQSGKTPMNRAVFSGIYGRVLQSFQNNNGNAPQAIRAGAEWGRHILAKEMERHPETLPREKAMDEYLNNFYTVPKHRELSPLEQKVQRMLSQVGQSRTSNSTYQNYVNDWRGFLTVIGYQEGNSARR